ncbi:MAG: hypothetical protein ACXWPI_15870 [Ktedonobacterales bacterium]
MPGFPSSGEREPATVLSDREAKASREKLIDSYLLYADIADDTISNTNRRRATAEIWSTMDREEAGVLADIAIERGMESPIVAQAVRGIIRTSKYARAGLIVGPRLRDTFMFYLKNGGVLLWA